MSHRILTVSFSTLVRDARVLRQIDALARHGSVTTLGFGPAPLGAAMHLQVPAGLASLPQTPLGVARLAGRRLRSAQTAAPALRAARALVGPQRFDLVVANDARALPLAHELAHGAPVWADMHEWAAEELSEIWSWRLLVSPLMHHLCQVYLPRSAAVTTVCESLAQRYTDTYGVPCAVVRNAGRWVDLQPSAVMPGRLRLVHSGAAIRGRHLEVMIDAALAMEHSTLDLFLVAAEDGGRYLDELSARAQGSDRIRLRDPVVPAELPRTLNAFDVGVSCLPPVNINAEFALPNKVFDFVQARIALAVGPSVEQARLVREHGLGVVTAGFDVDALVQALRTLNPAALEAGKAASHRAARELSNERDIAVTDAIVGGLLR